MSYIVPRDKPNKCTNCPFIDKVTYDCKLMYGFNYPDFESQYKNCPLIEVSFNMEQAKSIDKMNVERG